MATTSALISPDATHYCIKLNNAVKPLASASCWASTSALPSTYNASPAEGANIAYVWVKDGAANVSSATVQSNTLTWDGTAPTWNNSVAIVFTSPETSGWKHQGATLDVNYTANAVDLVPVTGVPGSGLNRYDYALGTGASGNAASNIIAWTSLNLPTGAQTIPLTGLSLVEGVTYYFSVRAVDNYDNKQTYTKSFQVDLTDPGAPTIDSPTEGQVITIANSSNNTTYVGTCESASGYTTTITPSTGVYVNNQSCVSDILVTNLNFVYQSTNRSIVAKTTKPSGRFAQMTRTVQVKALPIIKNVFRGSLNSNDWKNYCTIPANANIVAGDLLLVIVLKENSWNLTPSGWNVIGANTSYSSLSWKLATGTENGTTYNMDQGTFTGTVESVLVHIQGASTTSPIDAFARTEAFPTNVTLSPYHSFSGSVMTLTPGGLGSLSIGNIITAFKTNSPQKYMNNKITGFITGTGNNNNLAGTYQLATSVPVVSYGVAYASTSIIDAPSVTPTVTDSLLLTAYGSSGIIANLGIAASTSATYTFGAGLTSFYNQNNIGIASKVLSTDSATGVSSGTRNFIRPNVAGFSIVIK